MISDLFWAAAYILAFLGSISFGYLTVRYSIPDIREVPSRLRLAFSGIVGIIFFIPSVITSVFIGRPLLFVALPLFTFLTCFFFGLKNRFFASGTIKVALPVISTPHGTVKEAAEVELRCPKCKSKYNEGDFYCGKCGAKL